MTSLLSVARAVGTVTFRELVRDKILYNIFMVAILLLGVGVLASQLTYVRPERIVLDFGLSAIQICMAMVAVFTGSAMLGREFERRTVFVALSRPISRLQFIIGKFVGLSLVLAVNWVLLVIAFAAVLAVVGAIGTVWSETLGWALLLVLPQSMMLAAIAILFSAFSTTSLAAALSIGVYLIGNNVSQIRLIGAKARDPVVKGLADSVAALLPNLEHFNFGLKVTYGLPVPLSYVWTAFAYAAVVCAVSLLMAGFFARNKES